MKQPNKNKKLVVNPTDVDFLTNWYKNRKSILGKENQQVLLPKTSLKYKPDIVEQDFGNPDILGMFDPKTKKIGLNKNYKDIPGIVTHETNHYLTDQFDPKQLRKLVVDPIEDIITPDTEDKVKGLGEYGNYLLEPEELHSRLMQFRQSNDYKPDEVIDSEKLINSKDRELLKLDMFDDSQMLNLLNKTVNNDSQTEDITQTAKYGGVITKDMKKKINRKPKLPVYAIGGTVKQKSYGEEMYDTMNLVPFSDLKASQSNKVQDLTKLAQGVTMLGQMANSIGGMMGSGSNTTGAMPTEEIDLTGGNMNNFNGNAQIAAYGGTMNSKVPVNAEGDEVVETPSGEISELKGPSHTEGGINMVVPEGTEIFSKRLKGPDGKTFAERKIARERNIKKVSNLFDKSPTDKTLKKTLERMTKGNEFVEAQDMQVMEMAQAVSKMQQHYATGGKVYGDPNEELDLSGLARTGDENTDPYKSWLEITGATEPEIAPLNINTSNPTSTNKEGSLLDSLNLNGGSIGDIIGMAGNLTSTFGPEKNTKANRLSDTPNINAFKDFGKDALDKMGQSRQYIERQKEADLNNVELDRTASIRRNNNSSRSVNTSRALNLVTDAGINANKTKISNSYAQQMMQILGQEAGLENTQDQMVMQGEQNRDLADRQDKDNFFSQMAKDIATKGTGLQKIGKDVNAIKTTNVTGKLMNQMFPNFQVNSSSGEISSKTTQEVVKNKGNYNKISDTNLRSETLNKVLNNKWKWNKDGKLVDVTTGKEIDLTTGKTI